MICNEYKVFSHKFSTSFWDSCVGLGVYQRTDSLQLSRNNFWFSFSSENINKWLSIFVVLLFPAARLSSTKCDHKINKNKFVYFQFWMNDAIMNEIREQALRDDDIITLRVLHRKFVKSDCTTTVLCNFVLYWQRLLKGFCVFVN